MSAVEANNFASITVPNGENALWTGWPAIVKRLHRAITERCSSKPVLVVECYPGVAVEPIFRELQQRLQPTLAFQASTVFHPAPRIEKLTQSYLDESTLPLAHRHPLTLLEYFDAERLWHARREIEDLREGLVLIVGVGASLVAWGHVLVYTGLTRRDAQSRLQSDCSNLGLENQSLAASEKLRIASLVDWPVADRWKRPLITHWDFVLETKLLENPHLFDGEAVQHALQSAVQRPFRFTQSHASSTWPEQSLLLSFGDMHLELPALDLLMAQPRALLGDAALLRFGLNCPLPLLPPKLPPSPHQPLRNGDGWSEGRIVLPQQSSAIETRRLQFTRGVPQHTNGNMLVLELVNGPKLGVESPTQAFTPVVFASGQQFIVPAGVGEFILRPAGLSPEKTWVALKAFVRTAP
ncbi:MAG TPA: hypothetical protein VFZ59_03490 [Verrucomicrobiae bacterium]|nr:hypothetical protein [Verrucomicrobiae bacterium]